MSQNRFVIFMCVQIYLILKKQYQKCMVINRNWR